MHTSRSLVKKLIVISAVVLLAFGLTLLWPSPSPAAPVILWTPDSVTQTILAGESVTVPVSFTASEDFTNVGVHVVPVLEPYVQTNPTSFANITNGQTITLDLVISAPASSLPGTFTGHIELRHLADLNGDGKVDTADLIILVGCFGQPPSACVGVAPGVNPDFNGDGVINILDISFVGSNFTQGAGEMFAGVLEVAVSIENVYSNDQLGFSVMVPPEFSLTPQEQSQEISTFGITGTTPDQSIGIYVAPENPLLLSLEQWADTREWAFDGDWRNQFNLITIGDTPFLRDFETCSAITIDGTLVYRITNGSGFDPCTVDSQMFDAILSSLQFMN